MQELRRLLDQGYEVTLTSGGSADHDEYYAHVQLGGGPLLTGTGKTPEDAVWAASPLDGDDEPLPCPRLTGADVLLAAAELDAAMREPSVIDSHLWRCATCRVECIGPEPADSVCRGCGGA